MVLQPPLMCGTSEHSWLKPSLWGISPMYLLRWAAAELAQGRAEHLPRAGNHSQDTAQLLAQSHSPGPEPLLGKHTGISIPSASPRGNVSA